jgi:hypothetical protein
MTTEKKFDYKKPFRTRNGKKAELLADDISGNYCLCVKVIDEDNYSRIHSYSIDGIYNINNINHDLDLVNIPQKITKWLSIYLEDRHNYYSYLYETKEEADECSGTTRIACIKIEFKEGEGLEK